MIIKFPGEEETIATVRSNLNDQLEFGERIYKFWLRGNPIPEKRLPLNVFEISKMLNLQALRLFRTVLEECYRGEAVGASIASRSLFETFLALLFILKPTIRIILDPDTDPQGNHKRTNEGILKYIAKIPGKNYVRDKNDLLSRYHRAALYIAHAYFDQQSFAEKCKTTKGFKRFSNFTKSPDKQDIDLLEKAIGPEWSYVLRHRPHTYTGLNVAMLAELLHPNIHRYYKTVYHLQSRIVHGVDALRMTTVDANLNLNYTCFSPLSHVAGTLTTALMGLLCCMDVVHEQLGLGRTVQLVLREFNCEFNNLRTIK